MTAENHFRNGERRTNVVIVGAGPTGLALACDLRRRGIEVMIVDKALGPATTSRALGLQPRGAEILARLGALGDLPQKAVTATAINLYAGARRLFRVETSQPEGVATPGLLVIGQSEIERRLRERLADLQAEVIWATELVDVAESATDVKVFLRNESGDHVVQADWLVGCDGAHSRARKLAGISFDGTSFGEKFLLADVGLDWSRPRTEPVICVHPDGVLGALPLPGHDAWRIMAEIPSNDPDNLNESAGSGMSAATIDRLQQYLGERLDDHTTRVTSLSWASVFRFHRRLASSYRRGRILLAGDAAHIHSPFGGQGMNTGLGDAYNLGWKLALVVQHRASARLLDSYEAERRPVAIDVLKSTTANTNMLLGNTVAWRFLRDHVIMPMMRVSAIQRKMQARNSQLGVSYRGGPLASGSSLLARLNNALRRRLQSGDRAPDAPCVLQSTGEPTTLGAQTSAGWTLLLFGEVGGAAAACVTSARSLLGRDIRVIRIASNGRTITRDDAKLVDAILDDTSGALAQLYRAGAADMVLLRPDGHIACRAQRPDAATLEAWLNLVLDAPGRQLPVRSTATVAATGDVVCEAG